MLVDPIEDPDDIDAAELHRRYLRELAAVVDRIGVDSVAKETGLDPARLEGLPDADPSLRVRDAAAILALEDEARDGDAIRQEARDHLLLTMSSAVVDVDALASGLDGDLGPRDYQQMIEGRVALPLAEYARIYHFVQTQNPY